MSNKKSFVLYADFSTTVQKLADDDAGKLFKMILNHANGECTETDNLLLDIAFGPIKSQMDRDSEKWEKTREARSEAGKMGGRPRKAKKANASFEKQSKAKKAVNANATANATVNATVNDTVNDTVKREKGKSAKASSLSKTDNQLRAEKLFNIGTETPMARNVITAYKGAKAIIDCTTDDDWQLLERFYAAPQAETYARKSLATLYNNWTEELYKATQWAGKNKSSYYTDEVF